MLVIFDVFAWYGNSVTFDDFSSKYVLEIIWCSSTFSHLAMAYWLHLIVYSITLLPEKRMWTNRKKQWFLVIFQDLVAIATESKHQICYVLFNYLPTVMSCVCWQFNMYTCRKSVVRHVWLQALQTINTRHFLPFSCHVEKCQFWWFLLKIHFWN